MSAIGVGELGTRRYAMGGASIWHWVVVGVIVMLLFGRGKISDLMGDVAKGIKSFKKGMADDDEAPVVATPVAVAPVAPVATGEPVRTLEHPVVQPTGTVSTLADRKLG
jgi:sec-independent protein translocase protein TatA